jgi:hypothetical protein
MNYSLFQEFGYLSTGLNSKTKEQAVEDGINYSLSDLGLSEKGEREIRFLTLEQKINYLSASANIEVREHEELILEEELD